MSDPQECSELLNYPISQLLNGPISKRLDYFVTSFCFSKIPTSLSTQAWSTQAWSESTRNSSESRSKISAVLRFPFIKFTASNTTMSRVGLVARPSESSENRASCSCHHFLSSAERFSKAELSKG